MIGRDLGQKSVFDASPVFQHKIESGSIYHLLHRLGDEYLCDEDFREMCSSDWSRPIPPSLMAKVLLLQRHDDVSEAGAEMFRGRCKKPENEGVSPSSSSSEDLIRVRIPSS